MSVVQRLRTTRSGDRFAIWRMTHPDLRPAWFVLVLLILLGFVAVALIVQRRTGSSSVPVSLLLSSSAAALLVAVALGSLHRALAPLSVALVISVIAFDWRDDLFGGPLSGPFGYRNAFGALLLQGALAWIVAGLALRRRIALVLSLVAATVLGVLAIRSSAATAAGVGLAVVAAVAIAGRTWARAAVVLCGLACATVLAGTIWLGIRYEPGRPMGGLLERVADAGLTERRLALWHDALAILAEHPAGIGHGAFRSVSPTALDDRDARYAHNEFLEQGAELGWAGIVLCILLIAGVFAQLAAHPRADVVTAMAAVALAAVVIHACVDYVVHFPGVPLAAAALVGTGLSVSRGDPSGAAP